MLQVQLEDFAKTSETVKKEIFYFNECQKLLDYILQVPTCILHQMLSPLEHCVIGDIGMI